MIKAFGRSLIPRADKGDPSSTKQLLVESDAVVLTDFAVSFGNGRVGCAAGRVQDMRAVRASAVHAVKDQGKSVRPEGEAFQSQAGRGGQCGKAVGRMIAQGCGVVGFKLGKGADEPPCRFESPADFGQQGAGIGRAIQKVLTQNHVERGVRKGQVPPSKGMTFSSSLSGWAV